MANVEKSKTVTFQPGEIHTGMSEEVLSWMIKGEGATYREHLQRRIPCPDWGVELTARSITAHRRLLHGSDPEIYWDILPVRQT